MANDTTKNDWFIANLMSPNNSMADFSQEGLTADNIQLLNRDKYKNSETVRSAFTDDKGEFNEDDFNQFYDQSVETYNMFSKDQFDKTILNNSYFSERNIFVPKETKRLKNNFNITKQSNPFAAVAGIGGLRDRERSNFSVREIAQTQKVYNPLTDSYEEFTPNDLGFWGSTFKEPLVLSQWEEDGQHYDPISGKTLQHSKGDLRFNENGKPQYERLVGRSVYGRDVLSPFDVLTIDGSTADAWNFMSSDDKDKTLTGTVMKSLAHIVPHFIPGVGQYYTAVTLGNAILTDLLPVLTKSTIGIFFEDGLQDSEFVKALNQLEGYGRKWRGSTSDAAKESVFNSENFLGMVSDVFGQLAQQRAIAKIPMWLGQTGKEARVLEAAAANKTTAELNAIRSQLSSAKSVQQRSAILADNFGRDRKLAEIITKMDAWSSNNAKNLAIAYMAGISSTGIAEEAANLGLDERDSAALFLGLFAGLGAFMGKADFAQWALKGIGVDEAGSYLKSLVKQEAEKLTPTIGKLRTLATGAVEGSADDVIKSIPSADAKKTFWTSLMAKGRAIGQGIGKKMDNVVAGDVSNIRDAMLAEGLEEVSEEAIQDGLKLVYNGMQAMGWTYTNDQDKSFDFDNLTARYAMAAIGGAVGGAVVGIQDKIGGRVHSSLPQSLKKEFTSAIIHGYGAQLKDKIRQMHKNGQLGSTSLSPVVENLDLKLTDEVTYTPTSAEPNSTSQNDLIQQLMLSEIDFLERAIFQEGLEQIHENAAVYNSRENLLLDFKQTTAIRDDIDSIVTKMLDIKAKIADIEGGVKDATQQEATQVKGDVGPLNSELDQLREQLNEITSGNRLQYYLDRAIFSTNPEIHKAFGVKTKDDFALDTYKRQYKDLNAEQRDVVDKGYDEYTAFEKRKQNDIGFIAFKERQRQINPSMPQLARWAQQRNAIQQANYDFDASLQMLFSLSNNFISKKKTETGEEIEEEVSGLEQATSLKGTELADLTQVDRLSSVTDEQLASVRNDEARFNILLKGYLDVIRKEEYLNPELARYMQNVLHKPITTRLEVQGEYGRTVTTIADVVHEFLYRNLSRQGLNLFSDNFIQALEMYISKNRGRLNTWDISDVMKELREFRFMTSNYDYDNPDSLNKFIINNVQDNDTGGLLDSSKVSAFITAFEEALGQLERTFYENAAIDENNSEIFSPIDGFNLVKESVRLSDQLKAEIANKTANPFTDLINQLATSDGEENKKEIYDTIGNLFEDITKTDPSQFVINDKIDQRQLEYADRLLDQIGAVISAAANYADFGQANAKIVGYNAAINNVSKKSEDFEPLPMLDIADVVVLSENIELLKGRINFLLKLSEFNKNGTIRENRAVGARAMTLYLGSIAPGSLNYQILSNQGLDLTELDEAFNNAEQYKVNSTSFSMDDQGVVSNVPIDASEEAFDRLRKEKDQIEQIVFNAVARTSNREDIIRGLLDSIDKSDSNLVIDEEVNIDGKTISIGRVQQLMYLFQTISVDPKQFYKDISDDDIENLRTQPLAPFFMQELVLKQAYWSIISKFDKDLDTFNELASTILPVLDTPLEQRNPNYDNLEDLPSLRNTLFINGIPGAGKTTVVIDIIAKIAAKYGLGLTTYAPYAEQVVNLNNSLTNKSALLNSDAGSLHNLFESVIGKDLYEEIIADTEKLTRENDPNSLVFLKNDYKETERRANLAKEGIISQSQAHSWESVKLNMYHPKFAELESNLRRIEVNGKVPNIIVIDEATHVSGPLLEALTAAIEIHNAYNDEKISLILVGDTEQNSKELTFNDEGRTNRIESSIVFTNVLKTPKLSQSLRSKYNVINDNINSIRAFRASVLSSMQEGVDPNAIPNRLILKYKVTETEGLIGHKVVNKVTDDDILSVFANTTGPVAIITDKEVPRYTSLLESNNIPKSAYTILSPENVQGLEFDHVIIDVKASERFFTLDYANRIPFTKEVSRIYTALSRAKSGAIINKDISAVVKLDSTTQDVEPYLVQLDNNLIKQYKDYTVESIASSFSQLQDLPSVLTGITRPATKAQKDLTEDDRSNMEKAIEAIANQIEAGEQAPSTQVVDSEGIVTEAAYDGYSLGYMFHERLGVTIDNYKNPIKESQEEVSDLTLLQSILNLSDSEFVNEFQNLRKQLLTVRTSLLSFYTNPKIGERWEEPLDFLEFSGVSRDILDGLSDISEYKPMILAKTFNAQYDTPYGRRITGGNGNIGYLVLVDPKSKNTQGDYDKFITLAALPNISNKRVPTEVKNQLQALFSRMIGTKSFFEYDTNRYKISEIFKPTSNVWLKKRDSDSLYKNFSEFTSENSHLNISAPFLVMNEAYRDPDKLDDGQIEENLHTISEPLTTRDGKVNKKSIIGKPAVYITYDKSVENDTDIMGREFFRQVEESRRNRQQGAPFTPGTIRLAMLNAKGRTFSDWLNWNQELVTKKSDKGLFVSDSSLMAASNNYAAARILARLTTILYNYDVAKKRGGPLKESMYLPKSIDTDEKIEFLVDKLQSMFRTVIPATVGKSYLEFISAITKTELSQAEGQQALENARTALDEYFRSNSGNTVGAIVDIQKKYYPDLGDQGYFFAREHFLAKDILKIMTNVNAIADVGITDELELSANTDILLKGNTRAALRNMVAGIRVAFNGGILKPAGSDSGIRIDSIFSAVSSAADIKQLKNAEKATLLNQLNDILTGGVEVGSYKPLFPDGIYADVIMRKVNAENRYSDANVPFNVEVGNEIADFTINVEAQLPNIGVNLDIVSKTPSKVNVRVESAPAVDLKARIRAVYKPVLNRVTDFLNQSQSDFHPNVKSVINDIAGRFGATAKTDDVMKDILRKLNINLSNDINQTLRDYTNALESSILEGLKSTLNKDQIILPTDTKSIMKGLFRNTVTFENGNYNIGKLSIERFLVNFARENNVSDVLQNTEPKQNYSVQYESEDGTHIGLYKYFEGNKTKIATFVFNNGGFSNFTVLTGGMSPTKITDWETWKQEVMKAKPDNMIINDFIEKLDTATKNEIGRLSVEQQIILSQAYLDARLELKSDPELTETLKQFYKDFVESIKC